MVYALWDSNVDVKEREEGVWHERGTQKDGFFFRIRRFNSGIPGRSRRWIFFSQKEIG
jgi:hypothetical protein